MNNSSSATTVYSVLPGLQLLSIVSPFALLLRRPSMAGYFRMNGLLTFGIGGSLGLANAALRPFPALQQSGEQIRLNDYSIIGAALGGLGTAAIFAHRGFWQVLSMIPGGASMGIAAGFFTGILQRRPEDSTKPKDQPV